MQDTALGQYLRARRGLVCPEDVGLPKSPRRRVPGLRREELAMLAGISSDYYLRLEQGRDRHPSWQVIDAIARALRLDEPATAHLHAISHSMAVPRRHGGPDEAPASIKRLIGSWPHTPALVEDRHMDVLAVNALASALTPVFSPGVNLVRATFLDPEVRRLITNWDDVAHSAVARLRALVGADVDHPRLAELVRELSSRSEEFRRLWARHDIQLTGFPPRIFNHALVGPLELQPEWLTIMGTDGQLLIVYHAEPGSLSEKALHRLAALASRRDHVKRRPKHPAQSQPD